MIPNQMRQGDVLLHPIAALPENVRRRDDADVVLAHGEVTGHAHRVAPKDRASVVFYDRAESSAPEVIYYLEVMAPAEIEHEEHGTHDRSTRTANPGIYEVRRQTESWMDEVRFVGD